MTRQWTEAGHEVTVLAGMMHYASEKKRPEYQGVYSVLTRQKDVRVWRCHVSESYNRGFIGRFWGYFSFVFSSLYVGLFRERAKYDVVLVTSPPMFVGITGYILAKVKKIPFVFEVRDLWPESAIDAGVVTNNFLISTALSLERFIYKKADSISVLTPAFRRQLIERKSVPAKKIIFIPNAADFNLSEKTLRELDVNDFRVKKGWVNKFVIIYVGAHGVANYLDQILHTADLLRDTNALFVLIGSGMEKNRLLELSNNMALKNVEFLNAVPKAEIFKYIVAADMGTSVLKKAETFKTIYSNKTFDYMACKKPILMVIDGISRELVEEARAGVFVEPEDPSDFSEKILMYMNQPDRVREEGENGYRYAKANFDRIAIANRYLDHLNQISN